MNIQSHTCRDDEFRSKLTPGRSRRDQRGSALLMAVFVLALLTGLGVSLLFLTGNEITMNRADLSSKQAFSLAEAGLEDGRLTLFATNSGGAFNDTLVTAFGVDGLLNFDPDAIAPVYNSAGELTALSGFGDDQPVRSLTAFGGAQSVPGWYAAFLTNDPTELDQKTDSNDRVMLTGIGAGPDGSIEVVQAIIEQLFLTPPLPPAAITMLGPAPVFDGGSSGAKIYSGDDCGGFGDPSIQVPAIGVIGPDAQVDIADNLVKPELYISDVYIGGETIADLTDSSENLVSEALDPIWTDCMALRDMMAAIRDNADVICTDLSCVLPPSAPDRVVFVEGDYTAGDGQGLLAVTKRLDVLGSWNWDGLVLVIGTGEMVRSGSGNGIIDGGSLVANISGPDNTLWTDDDCTEGTDGFDSASFITSGGGNSTMSYCQASLNALKLPLPYQIVNFRQR
jgi:hypothetical protein